VDHKRFETLVEQALERLPGAFRQRLTNVAIIVEDLPPEEPEPGSLLLGLFHGVPRTEKSTFFSSPPDRIYLYQKNIEAICTTDEQIRRQVRNTLFHELGHYFGMTEQELRDI
jgi:predicted Zn-dependent protease with MMP-like domain